MIKILDSAKLNRAEILNRKDCGYAPTNVVNAVKEILENVAKNGDCAVNEYTLKFDGAKIDKLKVSEDEIKLAYDRADKDFVATIKEAAKNIKEYHCMQGAQPFKITKEGICLGQRVLPLEKVGLYVPGGTAAYPSSVLMDAIPAKIAGVKQLIMATPPDKNGNIRDDILVTAHIAGVDTILKMGGAQAIGALAYGTESVPKVDKIVGPGNIYVATAKKEVFGLVDIDMIAGPSEILVIADSSANPKFVAVDMLSQAEHDRLATAVLITTDKELANKVAIEIENQLKGSPREEISRASIEENGKIILVSSLEEASEISNELAPEHLELAVCDPHSLMEKTVNAGSIFLGHYTPEAVGDYWAGANHTLPTSGTAKFSSPLSVYDFQKRNSYIEYSDKALEKSASKIIDFAKHEGLFAHASSVEKRGNK